MIHPGALIDPLARLAEGVQVGAFCVIGPDVEIDVGTRIDPHVVIQGPARIGRDNRFHSFCVIGGDPQDMKYGGERTGLEIGDRNVFREYVTVSRGTVQDAGVTRIGSDNLIMASAHVAHDCRIGDHVVMANNATLAGHVVIEDWVILGGLTGVHQFCRIGKHAFIGMGSLINADVPPYVMVAGHYARPRGINSEGLKRRGFSPASISAIRRAYKVVYVSGKPLADARETLAGMAGECEEVAAMLRFIDSRERPLLR